MLRPLLTRLSATLVLVAAALLASCGDGPSAPASVRPDALVGTLTLPSPTPLLRRPEPLAGDVTASAVLDGKGGTIVLADAGLTVVVPPRALTKRTTITVTALKGPFAAYVFGPHGTTFKQPLIVSQELRSMGRSAADFVDGLPTLAYFPDDSHLDLTNGSVDAAEFLPALLELSADGERLSFSVWHFSGYTVATGGSKKTSTVITTDTDLMP